MLTIMPEELNFQDNRLWYKKPSGIFLGLFGAVILGFTAIFLYNFISIYSEMRAGTTEALKKQKGHFTEVNVKTGKVELARIYSPSAPAIGGESLPIQIVEFADFACPYSAEESAIFREMALKYGSQARFTFRFFPVNENHPEGPGAALAALCAQEQGQFWKMHDALFANHEKLDQDSLYGYAQNLDLKMPQFGECLESAKYKFKIQKDVADGIAAGVGGTPTFFINGEKIPGAIPKDIFEKIILNLIAQKRMGNL